MRVWMDGRSSWRGKALLMCSAVAMVALLCLVGFDGPKSRASMSMDASSESNNGGTTGVTAHNGDASDFIDTADLGDYVDAIIGPVRSNSLHSPPCPCLAMRVIRPSTPIILFLLRDSHPCTMP